MADISNTNTQFKIDEYEDMAFRYGQYVLVNGKVPATIKRKINNDTVTNARLKDIAQRIVKFKKDYPNETLNYVWVVKPTVTPSVTPNTAGIYKTPRWRHNQDQQTKYYCAPFTDAQIIYELYGYAEAQSYLANLAGTTTEGTSHAGIIKAVVEWAEKHNHKVTADFKNFSDLGSTSEERWKAVGQMMVDQNVGLGIHCLYRNHADWGHYMFPVELDLNSKKITLIDSLNPADTITVSLSEMELWIKNTPYSQPSIFIVKKIS